MQILEQLRTHEIPPCAYQYQQNQINDPPDEQQKTAQLSERIDSIKQQLGERVSILCHHYQKDEVVQFADEIGDSLFLAQRVAQNKWAEYIVFCGVHFMAETADMLTEKTQTVILPDLNAGCSMADMATRNQLQYAWQYLTHYFDESIIPITYINSSAAIKAFVGQHGGVTVTSTNAPKLVEWALTKKNGCFFYRINI